MIVTTIVIAIFFVRAALQICPTKDTSLFTIHERDIDYNYQLENTYSIILAPIFKALSRVSSES